MKVPTCHILARDMCLACASGPATDMLTSKCAAAKVTKLCMREIMRHQAWLCAGNLMLASSSATGDVAVFRVTEPDAPGSSPAYTPELTLKGAHKDVSLSYYLSKIYNLVLTTIKSHTTHRPFGRGASLCS